MAKQKTARRPRHGPPSIPELDQAAEAYYDSVQERLPYTAAEKEAKETLINKMVEHGQVRYETPDGFVVNLTDAKNVAVKRKKDAAESNGDGEE